MRCSHRSLLLLQVLALAAHTVFAVTYDATSRPGDLIVTVEAGTAQLDAVQVVSSVTNIVKRGAGDLKGTPLASYTGNFTIDAGCLVVDNRYDLGADNKGTVYVNDGGTLRHVQLWGGWGDSVAKGKRFVFAGAPAEGFTEKFGRWTTDNASGRSYLASSSSQFLLEDDATFNTTGARLKLGGAFALNGRTLTFAGGSQTQFDGQFTGGGHVVWKGLPGTTRPVSYQLQSEGAVIGFAPSAEARDLTLVDGCLDGRYGIRANGAGLVLSNGVLLSSYHGMRSDRAKYLWDGPVTVQGQGEIATTTGKTNVMNVAGPIHGSGMLTIGPGWLNLGKATGSTFSGDVLVRALPGSAVAPEHSGVTLCDNSDFFPQARSVTFTNGASLFLEGTGAYSLTTVAFGGDEDAVLRGGGVGVLGQARPSLAGLVKTGTGTLEMDNAAEVAGVVSLQGGTLRLPSRRYGHGGLMESVYVDMSKGENVSGQTIWCSYADDIEEKIGDADWTYSPAGARLVFSGYPNVVSNGIRRATAAVYRGYLWNRSPTNETWQFALHMSYRINVRLNGVWSPFPNKGEGAVTNIWTTVVRPGANPLLIYSLSANWNSTQAPSPRFDGQGLSYDPCPEVGKTNVAHFARLDDGGSGRLLTVDDAAVGGADTLPAIAELDCAAGTTLDVNGNDFSVARLVGMPRLAGLRTSRAADEPPATFTVRESWQPRIEVPVREWAQFEGGLVFAPGARIVLPETVDAADAHLLAWAPSVEGVPTVDGTGWHLERVPDVGGGQFLVLVRNGAALKMCRLAASMLPRTVHPAVSQEAFPNPFKGFRPDLWNAASHEYARLARWYVPWNELEASAADGVERIRAYCDEKWRRLGGTSIKVIPRVWLRYGTKENTKWAFPSDLEQDVWEGDAFTNRLVRMVEKLAACWDNDPRIAWVQMGIIGAWGEHHTPSPTPEIQKVLGDAFTRCFRNKKVLVRSGEQFTDYDFGYYWDSWAHIQQWNGNVQGALPMRTRIDAGLYRTAVIEGETAYDWGDYAQQPGDSPDDTLTDSVHTDFLEMTIRAMHCSALGWIANYNATTDVIRANADLIQKTFGYRYEIVSAEYDSLLVLGDTLTFAATVRNVGSAPFYYKWPVTVALLDPETRQVDWQQDLDVDLRTWLPGERWNETAKGYDVPAPLNRFTAKLTVPTTLSRGRYILALAIRDPGDGKPAVRFAVPDVQPDLWHELGCVTVCPADKDLGLKMLLR